MSRPRPSRRGAGRRLRAYWLETLPSRLKPKIVSSYRELYRLHLAPSLKGIALGELRRAQVKALLLDKQRQGLSRNTVRLIGSCLSALCSEAIDEGLLSVSPAAALGRWLRGRPTDAATQQPRFRRQTASAGTERMFGAHQSSRRALHLPHR